MESSLRLLNVQEIADLLGVKKSTIYQWTHQGFIPFVKVGKLVRFKPDAVMKWLNERETVGRKNRKYEVETWGFSRSFCSKICRYLRVGLL